MELCTRTERILRRSPRLQGHGIRRGSRRKTRPGFAHPFNSGVDPALVRLATIVHAADVSEDRDGSLEGRLYAIAHGFALIHGTNDHTKIELEAPTYDALYACARTRRPGTSRQLSGPCELTIRTPLFRSTDKPECR